MDSETYLHCPQPQVLPESKERKASLDSQDSTCPALKETKGLKDFPALQDSQGCLAFPDSRAHLEFQGSQVGGSVWVDDEGTVSPHSSIAHTVHVPCGEMFTVLLFGHRS